MMRPLQIFVWRPNTNPPDIENRNSLANDYYQTLVNKIPDIYNPEPLSSFNDKLYLTGILLSYQEKVIDKFKEKASAATNPEDVDILPPLPSSNEHYEELSNYQQHMYMYIVQASWTLWWQQNNCAQKIPACALW